MTIENIGAETAETPDAAQSAALDPSQTPPADQQPMEAEPEKESAQPYDGRDGSRITVRYGALLIRAPARGRILNLKRGDMVVVRTSDGTEAAVVVDVVTAVTARREHADDYRGSILRVIRRLTENDEQTLGEQEEGPSREIRAFAEKTAREQDLPVRVEDVEILLGGETVRVYYVARESFDLGPWVRALAGRFKRHFTLRKISQREAAKLYGDIGLCGQQLCCVRFVRGQKPVSMRMARLQKMTLDPTSLAGFCGPIRCCIRFEYEHYSENDKALPRNGCLICDHKGNRGVVKKRHLLKKSLSVLTEDKMMIDVFGDHIVSVEPPAHAKPKAKAPAKEPLATSPKPPEQKPPSASTQDSRRNADYRSPTPQGAPPEPASRQKNQESKPRPRRRRRRKRRRRTAGESGSGSSPPLK